MSTHYGEDLAAIHDSGFGQIALGAAETLIDALSQSRLRGGRVVELAAGSGISAQQLVAAGYEVDGFDISPQMVELAQARVPTARFQTTSLYDVEIEPCVAVTAIGEAFNYTADPRAGLDAMRAVFERAHDALTDGGMMIFDLAQPGRAMPRMELIHYDGPGWRVSSEVVELPGSNRLERRIKTSRNLAEENRLSQELHVLVLYEPEQVFEVLRDCGFAARALASYAGRYHFGLGHGGYLAVKR